MAEKSLVNDDAEMLGAGAAADELVELLEDVLELDDELPQPAINPATTSAGTIARFQPAMKLLLSTKAPHGGLLCPNPFRAGKPASRNLSHSGRSVHQY
jgi:hypothetical protein